MLTRYAAEADRSVLVDLGRQMAAELTPWLKFDAQRANATISQALRAHNPTIFVVEDIAGVIGFLMAGAYDYPACSGFYIQQDLIYVRPDKRGSRAAASLFTYFVGWTQRIKPQEVFAGIGWGRRSASSARWLKRFGFEPAGQQLMRRRMGV